MLVTKGYGLSAEDIDMSSPADMTPYLKAHGEELKEKDRLAWLSNQYTLSAVSVAIEHCLSGKKAKLKYIEKPFLQEVEEEKIPESERDLTEEEKKKKTEQLFMSLRVMGANFNLNHGK